MADEKMPQSDHDLLIRIDTKLGMLIEDFQTHRDTAIHRIGVLEELKFDKEEAVRMQNEVNSMYERFDARLRKAEWRIAVGMGILATAQIAIGAWLSML